MPAVSTPHPLQLLESPLSKNAAKKLVRAKVTDYWEKKLRDDCLGLSSLSYFKASFMSLSTPHPLWTTCQANSFELSKAFIQAKFLSGRYRTDRLLRHFDKKSTGSCSLCQDIDGSLEHLLLLCPSLSQCRSQQLNMLTMNSDYSDKSKQIIFDTSNKSVSNFVQLLLDCSVLPEVIEANQNSDSSVMGEIFKFSRTWCFNVHMKRMKMLGRWSKI